jgi:hypothetical protein
LATAHNEKIKTEPIRSGIQTIVSDKFSLFPLIPNSRDRPRITQEPGHPKINTEKQDEIQLNSWNVSRQGQKKANQLRMEGINDKM